MEAQELYGKKEVDERERLIKKGLELWRQHAKTYRILPIKYRFLVSAKKELKIKARPFSKEVLKDYPSIRFFDILGEDDARWFLKNKPTALIRVIVDKAERTVSEDYVYRSLLSWVKEAMYIIEHPKVCPNRRLYA